MLAGVVSAGEEGSELGVVWVEKFEVMEEVQGFGGVADLALDPCEVEAGWGLAWVGLDEAVEEVDGLLELVSGGIEDGEVGECGGLVGVLLQGGLVGGAGFGLETGLLGQLGFGLLEEA